MDNEKLLGGKNEMSIGTALFPASILGDITVNYAEGVMEAETQAGTRRQPSGKASEAEITATLFIDSMDTIRKAFSIASTDPIVFGGNNCKTQTPVPINIHPVCNGNDAVNDMHVYAGLVNVTFNPTLSTSDAMQVELTIQMQPTTNGYMLVGYPDPNSPSYWDVATGTWLPVED